MKNKLYEEIQGLKRHLYITYQLTMVALLSSVVALIVSFRPTKLVLFLFSVVWLVAMIRTYVNIHRATKEDTEIIIR